jgi:hemoglobin
VRKLWKIWAICGVLASVASVGCGDDADDDDDGGGGAGKAGSASAGKGGKGGAGGADAKSLCEKYGGKASVGSVVADKIVPEIAGDCRISPFFTSLPKDRLTRVVDCLSIQVEELFGCEGVKYVGSKASNGLACRSMAAIHGGLGISTGDFDALLEDVVAGLTAAGVDSADIAMAAPALIGLKADIVDEADQSAPSSPAAMCDTDAGTADGGAE